MNTTTNTVKLVRGNERVVFSTASNTDRSMMSNSHGEMVGMSTEEAGERVRALMLAGWVAR